MSDRTQELKKLTEDWDRLAQSDIFWSVLTEDDKKDQKWEIEHFYKSGRRQVRRIMKKVDPWLESRHRALDFGCGPGRLTGGLNRYFDETYGVDISETSIHIAKKHFSDERMHFMVRQDLDDFESGFFDLTLSLITLQHMSPSLALEYIRSFHRILNEGGVLVFQLPSHLNMALPKMWLYQILPKVLVRWLYRTFSRKPLAGLMEMNGVKKQTVLDFLDKTGFTVLAVDADQSAGREWKSFRYVCKKNG